MYIFTCININLFIYIEAYIYICLNYSYIYTRHSLLRITQECLIFI